MARGPAYEVGRYYGRVTRQAMGETSNGNAQFVLSFLILGKVNLADPGGDLLTCPQGERSVFRTITDKTIDYVIEDLKALGYTKPSFKYLDPGTPGFEDFTGKELEFFCDHKLDNRDDHQGELREQWGIARASSGPKVNPLDAKKARGLDALFGKQLKSLAADAAPSTAAPKGRSPATMDEPPVEDGNRALQEAAAGDDDIPF